MAEESADGQNWFRRHVLEKLDDLQEGQKSMLESQQRSHETSQRRIEDLMQANNDHAAEDASQFSKLRAEIESLKPVKTLVFAFVGLILIAVVGALVAEVMDRNRPTANPFHNSLPDFQK